MRRRSSDPSTQLSRYKRAFKLIIYDGQSVKLSSPSMTVTVKCCKQSRALSVINNIRQSHWVDNTSGLTNKTPLTTRWQLHRCRASRSNPALLGCGVPQGSVLGPLLCYTRLTSCGLLRILACTRTSMLMTLMCTTLLFQHRPCTCSSKCPLALTA